MNDPDKIALEMAQAVAQREAARRGWPDGTTQAGSYVITIEAIIAPRAGEGTLPGTHAGGGVFATWESRLYESAGKD